ncbi:hypothetical protein BB561_006925 [Smittium simulii]|uniref:Uncharacterized protein n=1 Tax=Smittium simulii TaxID=133385 RepID=A0A2T9XZY7_9FUNG|nr:hypothetical protein BB561_006924 [Smittium simulii]PVU85628.1 hypothetical protein BB561_006925 [Smittium simulii]
MDAARNNWESFTKLPTIKKLVHAHANKIVSMEYRRKNLLTKITEKKEEYSSGKVSLSVLNFVEKQTRNLPGSEELAKSIEQQTISIVVMDLKNKCENIKKQIEEDEKDFAVTITTLISATHGYDTDMMHSTIEDLDIILQTICDEIRTRFSMTQINTEKEKALKQKLKEERLAKMDTDQTQPKKSVAPKGKPKGAKTLTKSSNAKGSKTAKNVVTKTKPKPRKPPVSKGKAAAPVKGKNKPTARK